ncbi:hypothetical protein RSOLAG1IB_10480 [Rhizoctonia solani AG-1 IB]|uniref:Uncharacterized protein n=1 Tax=Thanatephorus cucumeris (strain AG1-IB / isolate 7/3/14) TaxID=1108050 RepID=A0A0B7G2S3_THACB|nr:hypothetical protein RSOLAG1IB_10480 [Rhizoctonia solani AG-1 IB]
MANIKSEFEEFGVEDDVMAQLQNKWETKVVASNVAQFEPPAPTSPPARHPPIHPTHPHPPQPPHLNTTRTRPMRRIHRLCNTRISHIPLRLGIRMRIRLHHLKDTSYLRLSSLPHLLRNLCLRRALE